MSYPPRPAPAFHMGAGDQTQVVMLAWQRYPLSHLPALLCHLNPDPIALMTPGHLLAPGSGPHVQPAHDPDRHSEDEGTPGGPRDAHGPHVQVREGQESGPERGARRAGS